MKFRELLTESIFDKAIKELPKELQYKILKDGLAIFHKSGKPLMFINNKNASKASAQINNIKTAMKTPYFDRTEFKDLGDLDWSKHKDI